jgi:alkanesulfonate monooxygenase SsuD/methylene tetrahydromethanopterin reductase-like flavin-dependent oxidoreductase (luciferase family)
MELGALFSTSVSTLAGPRVGPGHPFAQWIGEAGKTLDAIERAGFRYFAVTHAYQNSWTHPFVLLSRLAPVSGRLRMSTEILQLPLLHAADLAYALAALDAVSGGRLDVGVGIGYHATELQAMGVTRADRAPKFEEAVHLMRKLWTGAPVRHQGTYFTVDGLQLALVPVQQPHPPLWGSSQSVAATERAARMLDGIIIAPQVTFGDLRALLDVFRTEWAKYHPEPPRRIGAWRTLIAGADRQDAIRRAIASGEMTFRRYRDGAMQEKSMVNIRLELTEEDAADWAIVGNYDDLLEGLRRCRDECGLTRVTCQFYNLPDEPARRREWLQGFGEQVIARL